MAGAIEARGLMKTYPGEVRALDGLSFAVEAGTIFGLLGPNGAGKSTTVKILTTLSRPDEGEAHVAGFDVLREPDRVRRAIGVVAQRSGVDREATGRENLTLQGQLYGLGGRELKRRVGELLERFGLAEAADRIARTYSGGMQRRLDIAIGLVHRPQVLFLDEPTTGLDPEVRAEMWEEISRLATEEGITMLLTTHYLEEADRLAHRLAIVDRGPHRRRGNARRAEERAARRRAADRAARAAGERSRAPRARASGRCPRRRRRRSFAARSRGRRRQGGARGACRRSRRTASASPRSTVARPSLDDVYLRYAGRTYSMAEKEGSR